MLISQKLTGLPLNPCHFRKYCLTKRGYSYLICHISVLEGACCSICLRLVLAVGAQMPATAPQLPGQEKNGMVLQLGAWPAIILLLSTVTQGDVSNLQRITQLADLLSWLLIALTYFFDYLSICPQARQSAWIFNLGLPIPPRPCSRPVPTLEDSHVQNFISSRLPPLFFAAEK